MLLGVASAFNPCVFPFTLLVGGKGLAIMSAVDASMGGLCPECRGSKGDDSEEIAPEARATVTDSCPVEASGAATNSETAAVEALDCKAAATAKTDQWRVGLAHTLMRTITPFVELA